MKKGAPAGASGSRKPPVPAEDHAPIDDWMRRVMPDLHPIVQRLDELIRETLPGAQFAVKWREAFYGLPEHGWVIQVVAYDVSVNAVFLAGEDFEAPPPLGTGRSRYLKVRSLEELEQPGLRSWITQAGTHPGWTSQEAG